jgi:hypothetical protein
MRVVEEFNFKSCMLSGVNDVKLPEPFFELEICELFTILKDFFLIEDLLLNFSFKFSQKLKFF